MDPRRFINAMQPTRTLISAFLALIAGDRSGLGISAAQYQRCLAQQHQLELRYADSQTQPYAMNYADEAAQRLGIHEGQWEAFDTQSSNPMMPSFKGGVENGSAMFKLQWTPGS